MSKATKSRAGKMVQLRGESMDCSCSGPEFSCHCFYWEDALLTLGIVVMGQRVKHQPRKCKDLSSDSPGHLKVWVWLAYVCNPKPLMVRREAMMGKDCLKQGGRQRLSFRLSSDLHV